MIHHIEGTYEVNYGHGGVEVVLVVDAEDDIHI